MRHRLDWAADLVARDERSVHLARVRVHTSGLLYFTRRRDLPFPRLFVLFALFILACGTTHLIDALIFEYPIYRFAGGMKFLTAVVSWTTVVALVPVIPRVMRAVAEANKPGDDTKLHRPLSGSDGRGRTSDYIIALLAGTLAVLVPGEVLRSFS